jgi:threonine synthase
MAATKKVVHRCVGCGKQYPHEFVTFCDCGSFVEVYHDLEKATIHDSTNPYVRYGDLLPLEDMDNLIPVEHEMSPCHRAAALGRQLGLEHVYLKDETLFPTRTTKDRMATVVLSFLKEVGVTEFSTSSTGNSSTAFGHHIGYYPEARMFLFTGEDFLHRLNFRESDQVVLFGLRNATFVEAFQEGIEYAKRRGVVSERGFFNPARREGLKLAFMEATEQVDRPIDWYVQAVSSAMGVYGTYKGAKELLQMGRTDRLPRLLCAQQETCCPMVKAYEADSEVIRPQDVFQRPTGIAEAILRGDPTRVYPHVRRIVVESGGTFVAVTEAEIREARRMVEELEGLAPCFNSAVAVASLVKLARQGKVPSRDTYLVNLTGGERPQYETPQNVHWLRRSDSGWVPEDDGDTLAWELWEEAA